MTKKIKLLFLLIIFFSSCGVTSKMETERVDFKTDKFEISGFYYTKPDLINGSQSKCFVFYKNGVYFGDFSFNNGPDGIKEFLLDMKRVNMAKALAYSWGVFQVNGDSVKFEKWVSSDAFGGYPTVKYTGKVLNNKSILINTPVIYSMIKKPKEFITDTLYYYPFDMIPDNSNKFIK